MEYQGPEPADLANVNALNLAFLEWLRVTKAPEPGLPPDVEAALAYALRNFDPRYLDSSSGLLACRFS